jgi:hypothetical protein
MNTSWKRTALAAAVLAASSGLAAAQTGIPKDTQLKPGAGKAGDGKFIVIGCVAAEGGAGPPAFAITDSRPTPDMKYRLDGDADLLKFHVGHTVEIEGPVTSPRPDAGGVRTLKVESLTYLSRSCVKLK